MECLQKFGFSILKDLPAPYCIYLLTLKIRAKNDQLRKRSADVRSKNVAKTTSGHRTLHWPVCQLYSSELNLHHLFLRPLLDGATSRPRAFGGPLGKACAKDVWTLVVVSFSAVPEHTEVMSESTVQELSRDHRYPYLMAMAVRSGHLSENLAGRRIGASTMPGENKLQS